MKSIEDFINSAVEQIIVGKYIVRKLEDGSFYLEHESGEGAQCSAEVFEREIAAVYRRVF